jgi:hypothetical protein
VWIYWIRFNSNDEPPCLLPPRPDPCFKAVLPVLPVTPTPLTPPTVPPDSSIVLHVLPVPNVPPAAAADCLNPLTWAFLGNPMVLIRVCSFISRVVSRSSVEYWGRCSSWEYGRRLGHSSNATPQAGFSRLHQYHIVALCKFSPKGFNSLGA